MRSIEGTTLALRASLGSEDEQSVALLLIVDVSDPGDTLGLVLNEPGDPRPWRVFEDDGLGEWQESGRFESMDGVESHIAAHSDDLPTASSSVKGSTLWDCGDCGSEFTVYTEETVGESCGDEGIECVGCGSQNVIERS